MWNIIFTALFSMTAAGQFDNAPIGWKITLAFLALVTQAIIMYQDYQQEKLQDRVKSLENKIEKLVGEDK